MVRVFVCVCSKDRDDFFFESKADRCFQIPNRSFGCVSEFLFSYFISFTTEADDTMIQIEFV